MELATFGNPLFVFDPTSRILSHHDDKDFRMVTACADRGHTEITRLARPDCV